MNERTQILIDALEKLARLGNGGLYGNSRGNEIAKEALQKYEKESGALVKPRLTNTE